MDNFFKAEGRTVYIAYDGDNAGRLVGRSILADDADSLRQVSEKINLGHEIIRHWVQSHGGIVVSGGGDEGVFAVGEDAIHSIEELRADYAFATGLTATVGMGYSLSEAGKALIVGKLRGKNMSVRYEPGMDAELKLAHEHAIDGEASDEEKKLDEAYLKSEEAVPNMNENENNHADCPYCQAMESEQIDDPSHCRYCHDADQAEPCPYCVESQSAQAGDDSCPYCQNPTGNDCPYCKDGAHDPSVDGHPDDCPYCAESDQRGDSAVSEGNDHAVTPTDGSTVQNPTTTDSENYAGQDLNQPDLPKPDAIQNNPDGLGVSFDSPTNENIKLDAEGQGGNNATINEGGEGVSPQGQEALQAVTQEIDRLPHYESKSAQAVDQVNEDQASVSGAMEGGISRPENYSDENAPKDMGLAEDGGDPSAPDVTSLMQEGLDSHADSIQRERVVNLVSEALVGFKASKGILEKAKLQAPQLYESSIAMLKAMIEMAKMLGLDQEAAVSDQDAQNPLGAADSQDPAMAGPGDSNPADGGMPAGNTASGNIPEYVPKEGKPSEGDPAKKPKGPLDSP